MLGKILREIFYWVLNMSITAGMTGLPVMAFRRIKTLPRRLTVLLWAIPFLRMAVPFGLNSPYSLMALVTKITAKTIVVYEPAEGVAFSMMNSVMAADSYFPVTYKEKLLEKVFGAAAALWIIGALAIVLMLTAVYFTTLREMRGAAHLRDNVYLSDKSAAPAVYGVIRPRIILPAVWRDRDMELILLHEETHIRRADNLWRMLAFLIVAAHWFNPLCWVFLKTFLADLELSCDECVLVKLGGARAKEYARTLLESGQSKTVFASAFGGAKIRTRIENILSFRKMTGLSLTVCAAWIAAIFHALLTNAG